MNSLLRRVIFSLFLCICVVVPSSTIRAASDGDAATLEREIAAAQSKGLPQTAAVKLRRLSALHLEKKNYPAALAATIRRVTVESRSTEDPAAQEIIRLKEELQRFPPPMKGVAKLILAKWTWNYLRHNQWKFAQRTQVDTKDLPSDFRLWDIVSLVKHAEKLFQESLGETSSLRKTPLKSWAPILENASPHEPVRPTLYDFMAFQFVQFYTDAAHVLPPSEEPAVFERDSDAFAASPVFLQANLKRYSKKDFRVRALGFFQEIMKFHEDDDDPTAFVDADLLRLSFVDENAPAETTNDVYRQRLREIAKRYPNNATAALANVTLARFLFDENRYKEALDLAAPVEKQFPSFQAGVVASEIVRSVLASEFRMTSDGQIPIDRGDSTLSITYRNVKRAYFRIYSIDWHTRDLGNEELQRRLMDPPLKQFEVSLKDFGDFASHEIQVKLPALRGGRYLVVASGRARFSLEDNFLQTAQLNVSNLTLVYERIAKGFAGRVLNSVTGEPVQGATVSAWNLDNARPYSSDSVRSDVNGAFVLQLNSQESFTLLAEKSGDRTILPRPYHVYQYGEKRESREGRAQFFTDRALYRPGQTISFKVLVFERENSKEEFHPAVNSEVELELRDANSQLVTLVKLRSNDFGSASGSFVAPAGRLLGQYRLNAVRRFSGSAEFRIEEYKRPKFQVTVEPPTGPVMLDGNVRVAGVATTYSGVPVANAPVTFQVRRAMQVPWWTRICFWSLFLPDRNMEVEILRGKTKTDSEGKFAVEFVAAADKTVAEATGVVFAFSVHAAVLDDTGEERAGDLVLNVGFSDLQANFEASDALGSPFPLKVTVTTLAGKAVKIGAGVLKIYRLVEPERVIRAAQQDEDYGYGYSRGSSSGDEKSDWRLWKNGAVVFETKMTNAESASAQATVSPSLPPGSYRAVFSTVDGRGKNITAEYPFIQVDKNSMKFPVKIAQYISIKGEHSETMDFDSPSHDTTTSARVGETWEAIWGTGYDVGQAYVEIFHRGKQVESYYTPKRATQGRIVFKVREEHRGGFHLRISYVREHRMYTQFITVNVPWDNKDLKVEKQVFRSNLKPGQKEQWTLRISGPDAKGAAAEVVAALYDASLDAIAPHAWSGLQSIWPRDPGVGRFLASFSGADVDNFGYGFSEKPLLGDLPGERYPEFADFVRNNVTSLGYDQGGGPASALAGLGGVGGGLGRGGLGGPGGGQGGLGRKRNGEAYAADADANLAATDDSASEEDAADLVTEGNLTKPDGPAKASTAARPNAPQPPVTRSNLTETALFLPQLRTEKNGTVALNFTMPDALTTWKFMAFAHTNTLQSGLLTATTVTSKELMLEPNLPRFLRSGDKLTLVARLSNTTSAKTSGEGRLRLRDAESNKDVTGTFSTSPVQAFKLEGKASTTLRWNVVVPDSFVRSLIVEMVAQSKEFSDGEEAAVPVLSQRVFLTESKPFSLRKSGSHRIVFDALRDSAKRKSIAHSSATLEYTANASWYVVQALTYLMEYPFECVEQTFNRLYANALGAHIVSKEPQIEKVFAEWKKSGTQLLSPLERNQALKNAALLEMPWLLEGQSETAARHRLATLFESERIRAESQAALNKLFNMQRDDGSWPWYPGGRGDLFITMYVLSGMGRLEHLAGEFQKLITPEFARKRERALRWVDGEMAKIYRNALEHNENRMASATSLSAEYLYLRSFYPKTPLNADEQMSFKFWSSGAKKHWLELPLMNQAQIALVFLRTGEKATVKDIVASLRERRLSSNEMGVWWGDYAQTRGWWFDAPIETQAVLIELFSDLGSEAEMVSEMKVWLVQQKRTQAWHSTKATGDAVYALLLRGDNPLHLREDSSLVWGVGAAAHPVSMDKAEKGIGYVKETLPAEKVSPELATLQVKKTSNVLGWGAIYWQYFANLGEVTSASAGISIKRDILRLSNAGSLSATGAATREAQVGDTLRVRITIDSERDYEYVHLKDLRGTGFEPHAATSGYRYQDALWYYEMPRDTGTSFFIDYLPKGKHIFEYTLKVQHEGEFDAGYAEMQCFYAPEFSARSVGAGIFKVKGKAN